MYSSQSAMSLKTSVSLRYVSLKPGVSISVISYSPCLNLYGTTSAVPAV